MSLRGSNTLFADVFDLPVTEKQRKGRSESLISKRNEFLIDRYFFLGKTTGIRYELLMRIIAGEMFLSAYTVQEILFDNSAKIQAIKRANPTKKDLMKKWPHINWEAPVIPIMD
jgi:hypothetical protein